jgi:aminoglycoside phosphotransferase (APT) family kinase protein
MDAGVSSVDELTAPFLSELLGTPVRDVEIASFGLGNVSESYRLTLTYAVDTDLPASLVAKLPSPDPALKAANVAQARCETGFYREIAPWVDIEVPRCLHAGVSDDGERMLLLLERIDPIHPVDQLTGCSREQARAAAANLAAMHRSTWNRAEIVDVAFLAPLGLSMAELLQAVVRDLVPGFAERFSLVADDERILRAFAERVESWFHGRTDRFCLLHNDYRLDNLLFTADPNASTPVLAVDWGTISVGLGGRDLAYLISTGFEPEDRRAHERDVVAAYHEALNRGDRLQSLDETWDDYRYGLFQALLICVAASVHSVRSERADEMFSVMTRRTIEAIRDHDALSLLS